MAWDLVNGCLFVKVLPMQSLRKVLATFRKEVLAALEDRTEGSTKTRLEADRIVLSLAVSIRPQSGDAASPEFTFDVPERGLPDEGQGETGHRLTIEFKAHDPRRLESSPGQGVTPGVSEVRETEPVALQETEATRAVESLATIFGRPGFDSSARATVFRETLTGLDDSQIRVVVRALREGRAPEADPAGKRAWDVLSRLLRSGPSKSVTKGGGILDRIFGQFPVAWLIRLLEETWKTQDDWLEQPARQPRSNGKPPKGS